MIDERNIKKTIAKKQKEIQNLQANYDREKCKKHIRAFMDELLFENNDLIPLILNNNLNTSDIRIIASAISKELPEFYKKAEPRIKSNKEKREKKNESRRLKNKLNKTALTNTSEPGHIDSANNNSSKSESTFTRKY